MLELKEIYTPIEKDLKEVNDFIEVSFKESKNRAIGSMARFLLESSGKRLRPALAILSTKAALNSPAKAGSRRISKEESFIRDEPQGPNSQLIKIASAVELIHMASLLHDDVIDHSGLRHNKPTVNSLWGKDVAIALGDYLYSMAFELISESGNPDIIRCISCATKEMCEGELIQVCERDNLDLLKERYIMIVRKKTASLFAASCQTGALLSKSSTSLYHALKEYGLNFGIAFQIVDDYLDLVGEEKELGKKPCQDIGVGEFTLPVLNLLESVPVDKREYLKRLLNSKKTRRSLDEIKSIFFNSDAILKTKNAVLSYLTLAKNNLDILSPSEYKNSLISLTNFIIDRGFNNAF